MKIYAVFTSNLLKTTRFLGTFLKQLYLLKKVGVDSSALCNYEHLKRIVSYAWDNVPFYQKYWSEHGFTPDTFRSLDDFLKIPTIDKNNIIKYLEDFVPKDVDRKRLTLVTSGGTTGMPMQFYIDNSVARGKEIAFLLWGNYHYFGHKMFIDKVAIIRGHRIPENKLKKGVFWERSWTDNGLHFSSFHITEENYETYLNKLRAFKPRFIKAYPSSIVAFCYLMKQHGDFGIPKLKGVICSSENVYDWQRKLVNETLGVEIHSFYGHSEKCVCAFQGNANKMYFQPLYGFTEFLDDNLNPMKNDGRMAQVVVTGYCHEYFPLIRYKTYDYVEVGSSDNFNKKVANKIVGRSQEFVYDKNNNRIPFTNSDEVLWDTNGIVAYQYVQETVGILSLTIQVTDEFDKNMINALETRANEIFVNFDIEIKIVDKIERTRIGKFKYLIQSIKQ